MTVRVFARVNVDGLRASRWQDVPDDDRLADLEAVGYVTRVDYDGAPAPAELPRQGCCGQR